MMLRVSGDRYQVHIRDRYGPWCSSMTVPPEDECVVKRDDRLLEVRIPGPPVPAPGCVVTTQPHLVGVR